MQAFFEFDKISTIEYVFLCTINSIVANFQNFDVQINFYRWITTKILCFKNQIFTVYFEKMPFFTHMKFFLTTPNLVIHCNLARLLWVNFDVFKKFGFGTMIFHMTKKHELFKNS